jgi:serine/threonine-protein kinase HipA
MKTKQNNCLFCYDLMENGETDYHEKCCRKFFGTATSPQIPFDLSDIQELAIQVLGKSISVTGVQPKISLESQRSNKKGMRFTIVGMWGNYILKPPIEEYPEMPEIEDLTMHLAVLLKIKTAEHAMVRLKSGEIAYLTKRFDRTKNGKLPLEDMAQLTSTLTENKYRGSMEKIGKIIKQYSSYPGVDLITFYELTLFSFITGNADMHLKNFSLLTNQGNEIMLSPAYDLLSTKLLIRDDTEELALSINGKKSRLKKSDFISFAGQLGINDASIRNIHKKFQAKEGALHEFIDKSFLSPTMKREFKKLVSSRMERIGE